MDNEEAKFILKAYRPNGADAGNAVFCKALEQARRDPELNAWFEREQARDKAVAAKLKAVPIPAGLRDSILAGGKTTVRDRAWWRQPMVLAMAASLAVLLSVAAVAWQFNARRTDWSQLTATLIEDAARTERHGSHGRTASDFVALLSLVTTKLSTPMPIDLARLKIDGCRSLTVAGHEIFEVCFQRNGADFHLYVMALPRARDLPSGPQFVAQKGIHSVLWTDPYHLYVMASAKDETALRALL